MKSNRVLIRLDFFENSDIEDEVKKSRKDRVHDKFKLYQLSFCPSNLFI